MPLIEMTCLLAWSIPFKSLKRLRVTLGAGMDANGAWPQEEGLQEDGMPSNFMTDSFLNFDLGSLGPQDLTMGEDTHLPDNFDFWQDCLSSIESGGPAPEASGGQPVGTQ